MEYKNYSQQLSPNRLKQSRTVVGMRYWVEVLHPDYCQGQTAQPLVAGGFGLSYFLWGLINCLAVLVKEVGFFQQTISGKQVFLRICEAPV